MTAPSVFRIADIQDRIDNLPENGTYTKPFVPPRSASPWLPVATELPGCELIKVSEAGILHEKIAYFSRLPE